MITTGHALDLTDPVVRPRPGVTLDQFKLPWRPVQHAGQEAVTQAIGRLARERGLQGLLAPSAARPRAKNLVLFRDLVEPREMVAVNEDQYPVAPRSRPG